ncbi:hypothetical protein MA16_Dca008353 [Dendrobium catenatum]|uniref:Uncharacterized protein n=1 Tax=Dendrobium catenatum TaxID=906689 RepID=A0A2I0W832_9ASPA|nr:hypothetical protein MA16_Dca008353 [Dendrobium catenatum]
MPPAVRLRSAVSKEKITKISHRRLRPICTFRIAILIIEGGDVFRNFSRISTISSKINSFH